MDEQPQKSNTLKYVAIGCVGIILLGVCAVGSCMLMGGGAAVGVLGAVSAPAEQTKGFFADLRARNYQGALSRMSPTYQASHPLATFQQVVDATPALTQQTDDTISSRSVNNSVATMSGTLTTPQGSVPIVVTLTQNGAAWQIDSVLVNGTPLQ